MLFKETPRKRCRWSQTTENNMEASGSPVNLTESANASSAPSESAMCYHFSGVHFGVGNNPTPYIVNAALNAPVSVLAVLGNALVLHSFWKTKSLQHSPSQLLLCNLSLVDFGVGLLAQPFFVASLAARATSLSYMFCITALSYDIVSASLAGVALFTVTAMFGDKYASVCRQARYQDTVTVKRTVTFLIMSWLLGSFGGATWLWHSSAFFVVCLAAICLCLPIIGFAYFKIYRFMHLQQVQIKDEGEVEQAQKTNHTVTPQKRTQLLQNLFLFFLLLICYLPYLCTFIIIGASGLTRLRQSVFEFANTLVFIKSSLNPFIMCWAFNEIRFAVMNTVRAICCRKSSKVNPHPGVTVQESTQAPISPVSSTPPLPASESSTHAQEEQEEQLQQQRRRLQLLQIKACPTAMMAIAAFTAVTTATATVEAAAAATTTTMKTDTFNRNHQHSN